MQIEVKHLKRTPPPTPPTYTYILYNIYINKQDTRAEVEDREELTRHRDKLPRRLIK